MDIPDQIIGPYGTARRIPQARLKRRPSTLDTWLIDAPYWHPWWSQYVLVPSTLADLPEHPPAVRHRDGTTHEITVLALDPDHPTSVQRLLIDPLHYMEPASVCEQFVALEDRQAVEIGFMCTEAACFGKLNLEPSFSAEKAAWAHAIAATLDHYRDPHHGTLN